MSERRGLAGIGDGHERHLKVSLTRVSKSHARPILHE